MKSKKSNVKKTKFNFRQFLKLSVSVLVPFFFATCKKAENPKASAASDVSLVSFGSRVTYPQDFLTFEDFYCFDSVLASLKGMSVSSINNWEDQNDFSL